MAADTAAATPTVTDLRRAAEVFNGFAGVDSSWLALAAATSPAGTAAGERDAADVVTPDLDLSRVEHRELLLRWLNSWGCRIRYPREGEPTPFDSGVADWWREWRGVLPASGLADRSDCKLSGLSELSNQSDLSDLTDPVIDQIAAAYAALAAVPVSAGAVRRTLGPTAAAKALFALRPRAVMPWDAAIAARLHGARDAAAFARHLRLGRSWSQAVLAETGLPADEIAILVGRPGMPLAKLLDEYLYVTVSMRRTDAESAAAS